MSYWTDLRATEEKMKSRNRKIEDLYLRLRNIVFKSFFLLTKTYTKGDLSGFSPGKILVIKLDRIGDMVMSTPIFRALKEQWPGSQISVLVNPTNKYIVINNPFVDDIIVYDKQGRHKSLQNRLHFFLQLRKKGFDIVIDPYLDYILNTALISRIVGCRYRLGFEFAGREIFYNIRSPSKVFPYIAETKHIIDYNLDLIACLGVEAKKRVPEIFLTSDEKEKACQLLKDKKVDTKKKIIGIHPGGCFQSQRWPIERSAAVSDYLISRYSVNIILFGGPGESGLISAFKDCSKEAPIIIDNIGQRELMSVMSKCSLFLCNNSGPLHIATALNIPTVSTMGPTIWHHWWPRGEGHVVLRKDLDCSPCKRGTCPTHECLDLITTDEFIAAVEKQIKDLNIFASSEDSAVHE